MIDYKKWIVYLCLAAAIALALASCTASKKAVNVIKSHVDSAVIEIRNDVHKSSVDSVAKKTEANTYHRETKQSYQPIEIDSDYIIVDTVPLIIQNRSGKRKIYLPVSETKESGRIDKSDSTHLLKNQDSTLNENKTASVQSDTKTVIKDKQKTGFNFFNLLWLIPAIIIIILIKYRKTIFNYLK